MHAAVAAMRAYHAASEEAGCGCRATWPWCSLVHCCHRMLQEQLIEAMKRLVKLEAPWAELLPCLLPLPLNGAGAAG